MRLTESPLITKKLAALALFWVTAAGVLGLAVTASLAAPKPAPAPAPPTTTTVVDTTPPPAPVFADKPADPSTGRNAHFTLSDDEANVTFRCRLDGGSFGTCNKEVNYNNLDFGEHCLDARAADAAGNLSPVTTWCWSIVLQGGFPISGSITQPFAPGVTRPLNLVIGNPFSFTIRVTSVAVSVGSTDKDGCVGTANFTVTKGLTSTVDVPRNTTRSLQQLGIDESAWPTVTMPNLATNQDACKGATLSLTYTGQATRP